MSNKKITDIRTRRKNRYKPLNQIVKEELARCRAIAATIEEPDAFASGGDMKKILEEPEDDEHEDEKPKPHDGL